MPKPTSTFETPGSNTELFRVIEVLSQGEKGSIPVVVAATLASRGVLRWFKDTPANRRDKISQALDDGKRVEPLNLNDGRRLLIISDIEAVPNGNQVMIDGRKLVVGIDGEQMPAAELLIPGDVIELRDQDEDVILSLVDLADAV